MFLHLALAAAAAEPDCSLSEPDYYQLRDELRTLRRGEGESIGVVAEGRECERALDAVIRNGPFLGVQRVGEERTPDQCVAVLRPGAGGYSLATFGDCRADASGPSRMVSVGWWLPYGGTVRWNEDIGYGLSLLFDGGIQGVLIGGEDPFDLGESTEPRSTSSVRGMVGLDIANGELAGTYVGARGGMEAGLTTDGPVPEIALVSFVLGRKWITNGFAAQLGGGVTTEMPLGAGPRPGSLYPVAELRVGVANRH